MKQSVLIVLSLLASSSYAGPIAEAEEAKCVKLVSKYKKPLDTMNQEHQSDNTLLNDLRKKLDQITVDIESTVEELDKLTNRIEPTIKCIATGSYLRVASSSTATCEAITLAQNKSQTLEKKNQKMLDTISQANDHLGDLQNLCGDLQQKIDDHLGDDHPQVVDVIGQIEKTIPVVAADVKCLGIDEP